MIFWGSAFVSGRMLSQSYHPFVVAFLRFSVASIILMPLMYNRNKTHLRLSGTQILKVIALGLTGVFSYNAFFFMGLKLVEAGRASVIISMNPAITALASALILKDRPTKFKLLGIVLAFTGVLVVISGNNMKALLNIKLEQGEIYLLCAVLSWVTYTLLGKFTLEKLTPLAASAWASFIGSWLLLPFALSHGLSSMTSTLTGIDFFNIINLSIFSTCFGFIWYYEGVREIGPTQASSFINLVPIIGILCGVIFLDEKVTTNLLTGSFFVISGILLINKKRDA